MRKHIFGQMRTTKPRSACSAVQSYQGLCCPLTKSLWNVSMKSKCPDETLRMCGMNMNQFILRIFEDTLLLRVARIRYMYFKGIKVIVFI